MYKKFHLANKSNIVRLFKRYKKDRYKKKTIRYRETQIK